MTQSLIRIHALVQRHLLLTFRTVDRVLNIVYWPLITLVVWGGNMIWMEQQHASSALTNAVFFAMVLWQIVYRVSLEVANSLMEEIQSRNLVNLFATPVSLFEWIAAIMLLGLMNMVLIGLFGGTMLALIFNLNLFSLGYLLPLSAVSLLCSGISFGFIICAIFITWGRAVRDFMHALVWLAGMFSAIYYPLSVMPTSIQHVANIFPTTYIFELLRTYVQHHVINTHLLATSIVLNILYFFVTLGLFIVAFKNSKHQGLGRLE